MIIESVHVTSARRVSSILLTLIILLFPVKGIPQGVTNSLKPVLSSEKKLYGYVDTLTSKLVIKHQFSQAGKFHRGLAIVRKETGYGIIDQKGKAVYPLNSPEITQSLDPDVLIIRESKKFKYGALDYDLKQVIPFEYDKITPVGKVLVVTRYESSNQSLKELSGVYNSRFELIVPVEIDSRIMEKVPGYISNTVGNRVGLLTTEGKLIIPFEKSFILVYKDAGIAMVLDETSKWKAFNLEGKQVSDLSFDDYRATGAGCLLVEMNDKWGLFREKLLTPCVYDWTLEPDYASGTFILQKERKFGVTDSTGRETVPYQYEQVSRYGNEMFLVSSGKKYGLFNRSGNVIIPCEFDSIPAQPENDCFILKDNLGRYGCITVDGTRAVPFLLDEKYVLSDYKSASVYLKKMLEFSPGHPELIYLNALGYCSGLNSDDAFAYLSNLLAGYSDKRDAPDGIHYLISKLYADQDKISEASMAALYAQPSIYGHRAYMYLADKLFKKEDFNMARVYYGDAGIYLNREEAEAKDRMVVEEMKKRGLLKESFSITSGTATAVNAASLPTTLMGFAKTDRMEYGGSYQFKRLFTYEEAVTGAPAGFRLPRIDDWAKLVRYIADDSRIPQGSEYLAVRLIGEGWTSTYTEEGVLRNTSYSVNSKDSYGLGIMPLRRYSNTLEVSEYEQGNNIIAYWIEPSTFEGKRVNCVEITTSGFSFVYRSVSKACVRYIKK